MLFSHIIEQSPRNWETTMRQNVVLTYILYVENCQSYILTHSCLPIAGRLFYNVKTFHGPGISECNLCNLIALCKTKWLYQLLNNFVLQIAKIFSKKHWVPGCLFSCKCEEMFRKSLKIFNDGSSLVKDIDLYWLSIFAQRNDLIINKSEFCELKIMTYMHKTIPLFLGQSI